MAIDRAKNFVSVELLEGVGLTDTLVKIKDAEKLPDPLFFGQYNLVLYNATTAGSAYGDPQREIVRVTAKNENELTVLRGQEETILAAHNNAGQLYKLEWVLTAGQIDKIAEAINTHTHPDSNLSGGVKAKGEFVYDGTNLMFTLAQAKLTSDILFVEINGLLQKEGEDYNISGNSLAINDGNNMEAGEIINYWLFGAIVAPVPVWNDLQGKPELYTKTETDTQLNIKADKTTVYSKTETDNIINSTKSEILNGSPAALDTLKELADALGNDANFSTTVLNQIGNKVDKVAGKDLSTNDLTNELKNQYNEAYTHSHITHAPVNAQKNSDITKAEIEAKLIGEITTHTHAVSGDKSFTLTENITAGELVKILENGNISKLQITTTQEPNVLYTSITSLTNTKIHYLDTNKILLYYYNNTTWYFRVGTVSGNTITLGSERFLNRSSSNDYGDAVLLDSNRVLFISFDNNVIYATVLTITAENDIIQGTTISIITGYRSYMKGIVLTADKVYLQTWDSNTNYFTLLLVSGNAVSVLYNSSNFASSSISKITKLKSDRVLVTRLATNGLEYSIHSITGNEVTGVTSFTPLFGDSPNNTVVHFWDVTNIGNCKVLICVYASMFNMFRLVNFVCSFTSNNKLSQSYTHSIDIINGNIPPTMKLMKVSNNLVYLLLSYGSPFNIYIFRIKDVLKIFNTMTEMITWTNTNNISHLGNGKFIFSNYATRICNILNIIDHSESIGILQETGTTGQSKKVKLAGQISNIHSGLIPGMEYYYNSNGYNTENDGVYVGMAVSPTEILLMRQ